MQSATDVDYQTSTPYQPEPVLLDTIVNDANLKVDVLFNDPNVTIRVIDLKEGKIIFTDLAPEAAIALHDVLCDAIGNGLIEYEDEDQQ